MVQWVNTLLRNKSFPEKDPKEAVNSKYGVAEHPIDRKGRSPYSVSIRMRIVLFGAVFYPDEERRREGVKPSPLDGGDHVPSCSL